MGDHCRNRDPPDAQRHFQGRPCTLGFVKSNCSSSNAKVLRSGQVASRRAEFYLCLEWRRIMGGFKASGSPAGANCVFELLWRGRRAMERGANAISGGEARRAE